MKHAEQWFSRIGWLCLAGDGLTGASLVAAPLLTLKLMGVNQAPLESVFVRYIGVFVLCAGLFYVVPRLLTGDRMTAWRVVFVGTGVVRICVAVFVTIAIAAGQLDGGWISVPLYDGVLAAIQMALIWRTRPA